MLEEDYIQTNKKIQKLKKAYKNHVEISNMNLPDKFEHFEENVLKESETLLYETKKKTKYYKRYARGSIVKIKFGVNIGSEFSGDHFAIVVSKRDTMMNPTIHVIPLTSKKHIKNIEVGSIIYNQEQMLKLSQELEQTVDLKKRKLLKQCLKYYDKRKDKISYACIDHMKTVSKLSVLKPINEYDYLPHIKCSNEIMKTIDKAIINEYTI